MKDRWLTLFVFLLASAAPLAGGAQTPTADSQRVIEDLRRRELEKPTPRAPVDSKLPGSKPLEAPGHDMENLPLPPLPLPPR